MPFTFAHSAASIPILRPLGRYGVLSALVIGSLSPDLAYVLPFKIARAETHSFLSLFWFCIPIGLLSYMLFHFLLKDPLLELLPTFVYRRLSNRVIRPQSIPPVQWVAIIVSLFCGAVSHIIWDAFTHEDAQAVMAFPILQIHLFSIGNYPIHVFKLLQHISSCIGLALVLWWSWRWLISASEHKNSLPNTLAPLQRFLIIVVIIVIPMAIGIHAGIKAMRSFHGMLALQAFASKAAFSSLPVLASVVILYCVCWRVWKLQMHTKTG